MDLWGSDDWSASPVLSTAMNAIQSAVQIPDLLVCEGRYVHASSEAFRRSTRFQQYDYSMLMRFVALFSLVLHRHQATLFGPRVRSKLSEYDLSFGLSADLIISFRSVYSLTYLLSLSTLSWSIWLMEVLVVNCLNVG